MHDILWQIKPPQQPLPIRLFKENKRKLKKNKKKIKKKQSAPTPLRIKFPSTLKPQPPVCTSMTFLITFLDMKVKFQERLDRVAHEVNTSGVKIQQKKTNLCAV